jgi:Superfamily II DNA helicase
MQDTETTAEKLQKLSDGKIQTGVYHAGVNAEQKSRCHERWRTGKIHVVCATIGMCSQRSASLRYLMGIQPSGWVSIREMFALLSIIRCVLVKASRLCTGSPASRYRSVHVSANVIDTNSMCRNHWTVITKSPDVQGEMGKTRIVLPSIALRTLSVSIPWCTRVMTALTNVCW